MDLDPKLKSLSPAGLRLIDSGCIGGRQLKGMAEHDPGVRSFLGHSHIKPDDGTGTHRPQAHAGIGLPVREQLIEFILTGDPSAFNEADQLEPVKLEPAQP